MVGLTAAVIEAAGDRVTVVVAMLVQPKALAPVTVYTVVEVGVTTGLLPLKEPGCHVYETPPLTIKVELLPGHILAGLAVAVKAGPLLTVTVTTAVLLGQAPVIPTTEYEVVTLGLTTMDVLVEEVLQTKELAPMAVNVDDPPTQIAVGLADAEMVGFGTTIICTVV